jgi:hypothetical protein
MALRISKALRNFVNSGGSLRQALNGGKIIFYQGAQPTTADDAVQGTLLCTFTKSSGALTNEVLPVGVVTLGQTGAGTGSVDTFTVNSLEIMGGVVASLATIDLTAAAVVRKINNNPKNILFKASNVAGVVTLTGKPGLGSLYNAKAIAVGVTAGSNTVTQAVTSTTFGSATGGGVVGIDAINGLSWEVSAAGVMVKNTDETWSGVAAADGTAGWFRWTAAVADAGAADAAELYIRLDGAIAASGAELNGSTSIVTGATQTISSDQFTLPAA